MQVRPLLAKLASLLLLAMLPGLSYGTQKPPQKSTEKTEEKKDGQEKKEKKEKKDKKDKKEDPPQRIRGKTIAELRKQLSDKDVALRQQAALSLAEADPPAKEALPELMKGVTDSDQAVRFYCVRSLQTLGLDARPAINILVTSLTRNDGPVNRLAVGVLQSLGKEAVEPLAKLLTHEEPRVRRSAVTALTGLARYADPVLPTLLLGLNDSSFMVRRQVVRALQQVEPDPKQMLEPLLTTLTKDNDPDVCRGAAIALGRLGKEVIDPLIRLLGDKNVDVRFQAVRALSELGVEARPAIKGLELALSDEDEELRLEAALALGRLGDPAVEPLLKAARSKDARVRGAALRGLGQAGPVSPQAKTIVDVLSKALADPEREVKLQALNSLGQLGPHAAPALEALTGQLNEKDQAFVVGAVRALGGLGPQAKSAIPKLIQKLKEDPTLRSHIASTLVRIGEPTVPALMELTSTSDIRLQATALVVLRALGPQAKAAVPLLLKLVKSADENVSSLAREALQQIDPAAARKAGIVDP